MTSLSACSQHGYNTWRVISRSAGGGVGKGSGNEDGIKNSSLTTRRDERTGRLWPFIWAPLKRLD